MEVVTDEEMPSSPTTSMQNGDNDMRVMQSWDRDFLSLSLSNTPEQNRLRSDIPHLPLYGKLNQFSYLQHQEEPHRMVVDSRSPTVGSYPRGAHPHHSNNCVGKRTRYYSLTLPLPSTAIVTSDPPRNDLSPRILTPSKTRLNFAENAQGNFYAFFFGDPEVAYAQFLKTRKCYDVMPKNSKLVVLNTALPVKKALYAMIYNGVRSALLYDDSARGLCGHLTVSDFINILLKYYGKSPEELSTLLSKQVISQWRDILKGEDRLKAFRNVGANQSLYDALIVLLESSFHRIPVLDEASGNPLHFLTHKRLLQYLYLYMNDLPKPSYLNDSIRSLNIGTYENLLYVHPDMKLIDCLVRLSQKPISAVPVIENDGTVVDIYARFDAIQIAADGSFALLEKTVREALQNRKNAEWYPGVVTCFESDTLWVVIGKLVAAEVHGLIVLNDRSRLSGIITVSDVLRYMVTKPPQDESLEIDIDDESF